MASPQKENGYTPISNELLDAILRHNFISTHLKLILCCCRYTYGFSRKEAELSETYISKATGISKRYISQELRNLIEMNVLKVVRESSFTESRILELNKNYDEWKSRTTVPQANHSSTVEQEQDTTVEPQFNTTVEPQFHQDKQTLKQTLKQGAQKIFDYYLTLPLMKHKTLSKAMIESINKAMSDNGYSIEDCMMLLKRHSDIVVITAKNEHPIQKRGVAEFFGQRAYQAKHLICSEYEDGGKYYEQYKNKLNKQPTKQVELKVIEMEFPK